MTAREAICHFAHERGSFTITLEQNIICSKTHVSGITHEQNIFYGHLFAGHVLGHRMI